MAVTANCVIPIEMIGYGLSSSATAVRTFAKTSTPLNAANYDGVCTYEWEIVAANANVDNAYDVSLYDATNAQVKATITVPKATAVVTLFARVEFAPAAGNNIYQVRLAQTGAANDLKVYCKRMIVTQVGATKTRVQVPLLSKDDTTVSNSTTLETESTNSANYTQVTLACWAMWKRNDAAWGAVASYDFEAIIKTTGGAGPAYAILSNVTDATDVAGSEVSSNSTTYSCKSANFASGGNFHDGDTYYARIKGSGGQYSQIVFCCLYLNITDMSKGEVYWRVAQRYGVAVERNIVTGRAKIDTASYSGPTLYHEATCIEDTGAEACIHLHDEGQDADSDSHVDTATDVGNSALTVPVTKGVVRSAALTGVTSGDRIWARKNASTWTANVSSMWLVVAFTAPTFIPTRSGGAGIGSGIATAIP
jgi:hypothetical protein